jgi:hypothetical protein
MEQLQAGGRSRSRKEDFAMTFENYRGFKPDNERFIKQPALAGVVGMQLRAMYDGLLTEPLPERLQALVLSFEGADDPLASRGALRNGTED